MNVENGIAKFVELVNERYKSVYCARFPHLIECDAHMAVGGGRKYAKVFNYEYGKKRSIFAFVCKETGNIYKPAGYNAPAKGMRGNVMNEDGGMSAVNADGANIIYFR